MKTLLVIPARIGSTRFPAKPLHSIAGKTLLSRVVEIAKKVQDATGTDIVVATDHTDIAKHCVEIGVASVMTDPELPSGTDRALAAAQGMEKPYDFILNLQGDTPFTPPEHVIALIQQAEQNPEADIFTPVIQLSWAALDALRARKQTTPFSGTTCIRKENGQALWFSKNIIPAMRKEENMRLEHKNAPVFRHIGLYGYRITALKKYVTLPVSFYEELEGLEQLRFLENNMYVAAVVVPTPRISMSGVDAPSDAELAEKLIQQHGDPYETGQYI